MRKKDRAKLQLQKEDLYEGQLPASPIAHECGCASKLVAKEKLEAVAEPLEAVAESAGESKQVCRPWLTIEIDEEAKKACMALSKHLGRIEGSKQLNEIFKQHLQKQSQEVFVIACFSVQMEFLGYSEICRGEYDRVSVPINLITKYCLYFSSAYSASAFAIAHVHPSGKITPSEADKDVTKSIAAMAKVVNLMLVDHLICSAVAPGDEEYYSFRDAGLIK